MNGVKPWNVIGGAVGWLDERGSEMEISPAAVVKEVTKSVLESVTDLGQEVTGTESHEEESGKLSIGGKTEINFNENQSKKEADKKQTQYVKDFNQALKEEQIRAQMAKDKLWFEEEINDITANISTEEKNELLHYQASYKDRSTYQKAELRKKLIEIRQRNENKQKEVSIPSPAKQPSALEGAFEGRSGSQGSGTANLSSQAVG